MWAGGARGQSIEAGPQRHIKLKEAVFSETERKNTYSNFTECICLRSQSRAGADHTGGSSSFSKGKRLPVIMVPCRGLGT
jgi:hypothetical protein